MTTFDALVARVAARQDPAWSVVYDAGGKPTMVVTEHSYLCGVGIRTVSILPTETGWLLGYYSSRDPDLDEHPDTISVLPADETEGFLQRYFPLSRKSAATVDPRVEQIRAMALMIELRRLFDDDVVSGCRLVERVLKDEDTTTLELMAASVALRTAPEPHAMADSLRALLMTAITARLQVDGTSFESRCDILAALRPGRRP